MKYFGFLVLASVLVVGLFKIKGAELTNNVVAFGLMVLLLSLFADLKNFDFWGLKGEKEAKNLKELEGEKGVSQGKIRKPKPAEVRKAEEQTPLQLADSETGKFLTLAFDLERLLHVSAKLLVGPKVPAISGLASTRQLHEVGLLTESGVKQIEGIRWLRNMLVHNRADEITPDVVSSGLRVVTGLHDELSKWMGSAGK